jgi:uncharacterized protein YajQ (UPF0234 family)
MPRATFENEFRTMPDNSFDIVSKVEMPEVANAIHQALKEIGQR